MVKESTVWSSIDGKRFVVINVVDVEDHTWVHYRLEGSQDPPKEYSCYIESFVSRFRKEPD